MARGIDYLSSRRKRRLDIAGSLLFLPAAAPLGAVAATALKKELNTNFAGVLFTQERVDRIDQTLSVAKLRTMPEDGPEGIHGTFDYRAGRVGSWARRNGIDEIPQLVQVLTGKMSIVGPRPLLEADMERYEASSPQLFEEWYPIYTAVRKGLCGASQVLRHTRYNVDESVMKQCMELDLRYAETATLHGDVGIIAATPFRLLQANKNVQ